MKRLAKRAAAITITCALIAVASDFLFASTATESELTASPRVDIDTSWRLTKFGWQDSTTWVSDTDTFAPQPTWELVHPFIWATLVLLTVLVATIWASSEWEYAQLFRQAERQDDES